MKRVLKMSLLFENGKKKAWTLEDPKTGLNKTEVENALNTAITESYFTNNGSDAASIDNYYIYETNTVQVN